MTPDNRNELAASMANFKLPQYNEIPDIGLFLEQTTKFVEEYLKPLDNISITASMISNYVKKDLISNPVKKQYSRDQITHIFFIAIAKSVLSLENIQTMLNMQKEKYDCKESYEYFCSELISVLQYVFGLSESAPTVDKSLSDDKILLRNIIITVAHKVYLDKTFSIIQDNSDKQDKREKENKK